MKTKRISIIALFVAMVAAFTMLFVTTAKVAKADPATFAFEEGAYVKLNGDGGLRFRLKMDEDTATEIKGNANETLYFYVASATRMEEVTTGAGAKALFTAGNAWEVEVDKDKIYAGKDELGADDGYFYANVLIDANNIGNDDAAKLAYRTTDFVAAATVYDASSTSYTSFVKSVNRSMKDTASAGALRGGYYTEVAATYAWLGTSEDYAIVAANAADYTALCSALSANGSLYYYLDDVADSEDLNGTYANGDISKYTVSIASNNAFYGTVDVASVANVPYGTAVTVDGNEITVGATAVTATENDTTFYNRTFTGFTGYSATVTGNMEVTANFTSALSAATGADAYDYLVNNATTAFVSQYHGYPKARTFNGDTIAVTVGAANSSNRSIALSKAAVQAIYNLGYGTITFKVDAGTDYFAISFYNDTENLDYLSGATPAGKEDTEYYFTKGSSVTVDLKALVRSANFNASSFNNVGLFFWAASGATWASCAVGGEPTITLSDISFTEIVTTPEEDAFNVLATQSSWGSHYHGYADTLIVDDDVITVPAKKANSDGRGFVIKKDAITALYNLGFEYISFKVTTSAGGYFDIYCNLNDSNNDYISNNYTANGTEYYFTSGDTVTLNLSALASGLNSEGLKFVVTTSLDWTFYTSDVNVSFSDIEFPETMPLTAEQRALNVLTTASSYYNSYYHGRIYNGMIDLSGDDVTYTVVHNSGGIGFMLKNSAVQELYELGFTEMTFTLNTGAGGYCAVVFWEDTASLSYLSDNYAATQTLDGATAYYFASGTEVTVNLAALVNNSAFMNASQGAAAGGLCFNVTTAASWSHYSGSDTTITFADIKFTDTPPLTAEQQAFNVLSSASSYGTQYHGTFGGVSSSGDSVSVSANKGWGSDFRGFTLSPSAIQALYDLGFEKVSFTVTLPSGCYIDFYNMSDPASCIEETPRWNDSGEYYFASGDTITLNLANLVNDTNAMKTGQTNGDGIKICVTNGMAWAAYTTNCTVTFSDITFTPV